MGALWLDNGDTNPFNLMEKKILQFNLYKERSEEMYSLYSGKKQISKDGEIWKIYDGIEAAIAIKLNKDISPIDVVPYQDHRWFDTMHTMIGAWEMGKDFDNYSCKDFIMIMKYL